MTYIFPTACPVRNQFYSSIDQPFYETMPESLELSVLDRSITPLVSVIMPTFNPTQSIGRAIESVLEQTFSSWELIIIDDGSARELEKLLSSYTIRDARIRTVRLEENGGPAVARNIGLTVSRGKWIALLDDDDSWLPTRLERLTAEAQRRSVDMIFDNILGFDDHSNEVTGPIFSELPNHIALLDVLEPRYRGVLNLGYLKPLIRREFLVRNSIRYDEKLRVGEDFLLLLEVLTKRITNYGVDDALYVYTTQVGRKSGLRSSTSRSVPSSDSIGEAVLRFCRQNEGSLAPSERQALEQRAQLFLQSMPLAEFHHAKLTGKWMEVLCLLFRHSLVRRYVGSKLGERLRQALAL
jgi:succinoglycan biosynthesis protein ExoO